MRASLLSTALLTVGLLLGCRQPSADLQLPDARAAEPEPEPSGRDAPAVFVEAPQPSGASTSALVLDWTQVDDRLAALIDGERVRVDYDHRHPWVGAATPLVTIVVFGDYECPYCGRLETTLVELLQTYPQQLRVVYRQYPLPMHAGARTMAAVALAAHARGQFEVVHSWLYASRKLDRPALTQQLANLGLDPQLLLDEVDAGYYDDIIDDDMRLATRCKVTGTPTYFVNGRMQSGARPRADIEAMIVEELALAERLIAAGSAPEQVWARIMAASTPPHD